MWAEANTYFYRGRQVAKTKAVVFTKYLKSSFWMIQNQMDSLSVLLIFPQWLKRIGICWRN